ncbi:hypothetical protein [Pseudomarimonas salicorniae]|uniref:Uncharacterized protein n=1 Tax=Pseudomarimonas salicorniae TaxID=2933270 RepID=A0ABT0GM48_9GAMM|nr:hypothetical protein [Lysobacter sp. CAU 1642]MCK7595623.1 hypothetical protein [Lysobacter sp. CAU 1642]
MKADTLRFLLFPMAALLFCAAHLGYEWFTGGVQSHHLLGRDDLPELSNWLGLLVLPALGIGVGLRARKLDSSTRPARRALWAAILGALAYGAALAITFELDATAVTAVIFFGLFAVALAFPIYRVEYVFGWVIGMSFTFGSMLPLLWAVVFGGLSLVARWLGRHALALFGRMRAARGAVG